MLLALCFFFSSRRRHTRLVSDWSSDVCSSDLHPEADRGDDGPGAVRRGVQEARAQSQRLSRTGQEGHRAPEGANGVGGRREGDQVARADHRRRRRWYDPRACGRDVPPARWRRDGRHGKAVVSFALGDSARDVTHGSYYTGRFAARIHRTVPEGHNAEGHVREIARFISKPSLLRAAALIAFLKTL